MFAFVCGGFTARLSYFLNGGPDANVTPLRRSICHLGWSATPYIRVLAFDTPTRRLSVGSRPLRMSYVVQGVCGERAENAVGLRRRFLIDGLIFRITGSLDTPRPFVRSRIRISGVHLTNGTHSVVPLERVEAFSFSSATMAWLNNALH